MSNDAYSNMAERDKADLHDLWVEEQERAVGLDKLMERLKVCYNNRHPNEIPWEVIADPTKSYYKYRVKELTTWLEKMEREDAKYKLCAFCDGDGYITVDNRQADGTYQIDCEWCQHTGRVIIPTAQ